MNLKIERYESILQREISYILAREVKDKAIKFVTVNEVRLVPDLSIAKVYYTVLDKEIISETAKALKNATGFIRKKLAGRVEMRHIPELEFVYDESVEYGFKIESILKEIKNKDN